MTYAASPTSDSNAEQVTYWNTVGGPKWVQYQEILDRQLAELSTRTMEAAGLEAGQSVLDIGCGCGSTTLEVARRVGPSGSCTGIDISRPMLDLARNRAQHAGITNAKFVEADAQTHGFLREYDVLFSRFGVMFFDDPIRAFTNLHRALRSRGHVAFVCWQALPLNPWMAVPMMAAVQHVTLEVPSSPEAPGPFAFADRERLERILRESGFAEIGIKGHEVPLSIGGGGTAEQAVDFLMDMGPLSRSLREATDEQKTTVRRVVLESLRPYESSDGVKLNGAVWIATARA